MVEGAERSTVRFSVAWPWVEIVFTLYRRFYVLANATLVYNAVITPFLP
jgi:hypothetical protein